MNKKEQREASKAQKEFIKVLRQNKDKGAEISIALANEVRLTILEVLNYNRNGLMLSELQQQVNKNLKHAFTLSNIFDHVAILEKQNLVTTKRLWGEHGQPKIIKINVDMLPITLTVGKVNYLLFGKNL